MKYLETKNIAFSDNTYDKMKMIDGMYFSTRYPGEDSVELDARDIKDCAYAIEYCRNEVIQIIHEKNIEKISDRDLEEENER